MPSNHLILCHPLLFLSSIFPSFRVISNELSLCIRWPNYWSFSTSPSNEYSGLISFRMDPFDLLTVQRTLQKSSPALQFKSISLQCSAFFMFLLYVGTYLYMTVWTFVSKVMSLLFNTLSWFVIAFLPRSKCLLISWLQSPSAVILEPKKIKSCLVYIMPSVFPH